MIGPAPRAPPCWRVRERRLPGARRPVGARRRHQNCEEPDRNGPLAAK